MTISEALEKVAKAYTPGVAAHYEKTTPDPWQRTHDDLEQLVFLKDDAILQAGLDRFVRECVRLIEVFQSVASPPKKMSPADAFYIGDEEQVRKWHSRMQKHCIRCESKSELMLISDPGDPLGALIVCKECKQKAAA